MKLAMLLALTPALRAHTIEVRDLFQLSIRAFKSSLVWLVYAGEVPGALLTRSSPISFLFLAATVHLVLFGREMPLNFQTIINANGGTAARRSLAPRQRSATPAQWSVMGRKGLKAAMTVAAIAGALDNEFSRRPGEVLEHLNRALRSREGEGFVTCCAALVERSGEIAIANAGHLPPYAGGVELAVEAELPLGVVDGVSYSETRLQLKRGERLTFVSDGVVEAKAANEELFGFERTRAISGEAPEAIARVAREFGQDDDITVVQVGLAEAV